MKKDNINHETEFRELTHDLSAAMGEVEDSVRIGAMLYTIAEEKKSSNLVVREINGKFDNIMEKLDKLTHQLSELNNKLGEKEAAKEEIQLLSGRDQEILDFVSKNKKVCADEIKEKYKYRGRNAASARLSRLFKDGLLEKDYAGRKVYYKVRA